MGAMSDLHMLADEVRDMLNSDAESLDQAVDAMARHSSYGHDEIKWAYQERFGVPVTLEDAGRYKNLRANGDIVVSLDPNTGELCVYEPDEEEPIATFDLDL